MDWTIYHNPRCSKSRLTLALLHDAAIEPQVVEYLETPPAEAEIDALLRKLDVEPPDIIRFTEAQARELGLTRGDTRGRDEWIRLIVAHPILLQRPIVVHGQRAVIGRPPEAVKALID